MRDIAENLKNEILDIKNIASVQIAGFREREIWIEVNPNRLKAYQIPTVSVVKAIGANNLNLPAGTMELGNTEFMVRTMVNLRGQIQSVKLLSQFNRRVPRYV